MRVARGTAGRAAAGHGTRDSVLRRRTRDAGRRRRTRPAAAAGPEEEDARGGARWTRRTRAAATAGRGGRARRLPEEEDARGGGVELNEGKMQGLGFRWDDRC